MAKTKLTFRKFLLRHYFCCCCCCPLYEILRHQISSAFLIKKTNKITNKTHSARPFVVRSAIGLFHSQIYDYYWFKCNHIERLMTLFQGFKFIEAYTVQRMTHNDNIVWIATQIQMLKPKQEIETKKMKVNKKIQESFRLCGAAAIKQTMFFFFSIVQSQW